MSVQVRLMGLSDDVDATVTQLRETFTVVGVSTAYPNRGSDERARVYVTISPSNRKDGTQ